MKAKHIKYDDIYVQGDWLNDDGIWLLMKVDWVRYMKIFNIWGKYD